jgi:hypothetical protein
VSLLSLSFPPSSLSSPTSLPLSLPPSLVPSLVSLRTYQH